MKALCKMLEIYFTAFLTKAGIYSDVVRERGLEPPRPEGH